MRLTLPALQQLDNTHTASDEVGFFSPSMTSRLLNRLHSLHCGNTSFTQATEDFTVVVYIFYCPTSILKTTLVLLVLRRTSLHLCFFFPV